MTWDSVRSRVRAFHATSNVLMPSARDFDWDPVSLQLVFLGSLLVGSTSTSSSNSSINSSGSSGSNSRSRSSQESPNPLPRKTTLSKLLTLFVSDCPLVALSSSAETKEALLPHAYGLSSPSSPSSPPRHPPPTPPLPPPSPPPGRSPQNGTHQTGGGGEKLHCAPLLPTRWFQRQAAVAVAAAGHHDGGGGGADVMTTEEVMLKERRRITTQGITSFQMHHRAGDGATVILFPFEHDLYCGAVDLAAKGVFSPSLIPNPSSVPRMDAKLGGRRMDLVAFVRSRDLWVTTLDGRELRLTDADAVTGGSATSCGTAEFIMQEEFRRFTGFWWAPPVTPAAAATAAAAAAAHSGISIDDNDDGGGDERILFMEVDEGAVEMVSIARAGLDDKVDRYRYPRPGRPNARSEPCVATFRGGGGDGGGGGAGLLRDPVVRRLRGELQVRALFPWAEYIPRIGWMPDGKSVWMQLLDRPQQRYVLIHVPLTLFTAEGESAFGRVTVLFEDTSDYWINVTDISYFFKPQNGVAEFIWSSERTGYRHLYYVVCPLESDDTPGPLAFPGRRVRQITSGPWQVVDNSIWVDEGKQLVYFIGKKDNPLENHLYVTSYATTDLAAAATEFAPAESDYPTPAASEPPDRSQLLTEPGFSHSIRMDASSRFFVATSSSVESRPRSTLFRIALHHASPAAESPRAPTVSTSVSTTATSNARTGERSPARAAAAAATSPSLQQYQQPVSLRGRKHSLQDARAGKSTSSQHAAEHRARHEYASQARRNVSREPGVAAAHHHHHHHHHRHHRQDCALGSGDGGPAPAGLGVRRSRPDATASAAGGGSGGGFLVLSDDGDGDGVDVEMSDSAGVAAESEAANLQAVRVGALFWKEHEQTAAVVANAVPEIFSFYNSQGVQIYGMVYRPPNFHPGRKYPVLLRVYGGPNVQMITNDYKYPKFLRVFLALSFGYVVVMIDSQGSYDRGVRFEGAIKGRLGAVELNDQVEGLLYLATRDEPSGGGGGGFDVGASSGSPPQPGSIKGSERVGWNLAAAWDELLAAHRQNRLGGFIDPTNVCITGWSYGGYLSLMGLANFPHVFRVAIAGAPVTSWELYDSAYTERYLGLIEENADGYRRGSVLDVIQKFPDHENRLLIVHGSIDENVHFKNTELVVSALIRAAKPHRVQVYPGERHGLRAADVVEHFETLMMWTLLNAPPLLPP